MVMSTPGMRGGHKAKASSFTAGKMCLVRRNDAVVLLIDTAATTAARSSTDERKEELIISESTSTLDTREHAKPFS